MLFLRGDDLMIRKQFKSLKTGAKRVFVGLVLICVVCTTSGIGSMFAYADENYEHVHELSATDNGDGTHTVVCSVDGCSEYPVTEPHEYNSEGVCLVCGSIKPEPDTDPENEGGNTSENNESGNGTNQTTDAENSNQNAGNGDETGSAEQGNNTEAGNGTGSEGTDSQNIDGNSDTQNTDTDTQNTNENSGSQNANEGTDNQNTNESTEPAVTPDNENGNNNTPSDTENGNAVTPDGSSNEDSLSDDSSDLDNNEGSDESSNSMRGSMQFSTRSVGEKSIAESDVTFSLASGFVFNADGDIDYVASSASFNSSPFAISYNGAPLSEGTDFTTNISQLNIPSAPECGSTYTVTFAGMGMYTGTVSKNIVVGDVPVTYNGSTEKESTYAGSVTFAAQGYQLSLSETGTYSASLAYTTHGVTSPTVYFSYDATDKKVSKTIPAIEIGDHAFNEFFTSPLEVETDLVFTAEPQLILKNIMDPVVGTTGVDSVKRNTDMQAFYFRDAATDISATYELEYKVGTDTTVLSKTFNTSISPRDITDSAVTVAVDSNVLVNGVISYAKVISYSDAITVTYQKPNGDVYQLVEGTDYDLELPGISDPATASSMEDVYKLRIKGKGNFTGTVEKDVVVLPVAVTFNDNTAKNPLYIKEVVIKSADADYTIALDKDAAFDTQIVYNKTGKNQEIAFYLKNRNTGKVILQKASGISIAYPELLYDGKPTMSSYYEGSVNLSAYDFRVTKVVEDDGTVAAVNADYYLRQTIGTGQSFTIYFVDATGIDSITEIPIRVTGLDIYKGMDIGVLYNGESYKKWFNKAVTITAPGYLISAHGENDFAQSYKVSKEGKNKVSLDFKNTLTVKNYTLDINIDKHAPKGQIKVAGYISKKFKKSDNVGLCTVNPQTIKISFEDELSGKDYIKYYISEKFYSTIDEALADTKSDATAWKTYDGDNKPSISVDKKNYIYVILYDKAGNQTPLSTECIIYDTMPPTVVSAKIGKDQTGEKTIAAVGGQDKLSGIEYFKLIYNEKPTDANSKQPVTPSKNDVSQNGIYIGVNEEKDGAAVGLYTLSEIDLSKQYNYYVVAVDNAGNVSEVFNADVDKQIIEDAKKAEKEKSGSSSALTPAANGIAGGGGGQNNGGGGSGAGAGANGADGAASGAGGKGKSGSGSGTSGSKDSASEMIAEREINRDPYISNATGSTSIGAIKTSGWKNIVSEIKKADHGAFIEIEMSGLSEVPDTLFTSLKERDDVLVRLMMADDVKWEISGFDIHADYVINTDLGVKLGTKNIPAKILSDIAGVYPHVEFSTKTDGDLGFDATVFIPVGSSNAGMNGTLYYYNKDDKELILDSESTVSENGYAKYKLSHCSDYTVIVSPVSLVDKPNMNLDENTLIKTVEYEIKDNTIKSKSVRLTDTLAVGSFGRVWLFVIAILCAALCVAILMIPSFKKDDSFDDF